MEVIKSVYENQNDILRSAMKLCDIDQFCCDLSYGNGAFYKEIGRPRITIDVDESTDADIHASSTDTGLADSSINSAVFDPPFLTYVRQGRAGNGSMIMSNRFSGYWRYDELEDHYRGTINEAYRILGKKGILIFKCQDIIHNHKMHPTHINVVNWADGKFRLKDMFILPAKHRLPSPNRGGKQRHARIFHSYFLVLESLKRK
jgi:hypothetical protein